MRLNPKPILFLALTLAAVLTVGALPGAAGAASGRTVAVTATANVKVPNDTAKVGFGVSRERKTRTAALRATATGLRRVIAAAKAFPGVGAGDVRTGRIDVHPVRKGGTTVYRATEGIRVTLHRPAKAGALIAKGLGAGASGVDGPSFSVGGEGEAFAKVLAAAFDKARGRAAVLAARAGANLGQALTIEEGEGAEFIGPRFDERLEEGGSLAAAGPRPPTRPGTSRVKATVHVVFELQ